MRTRFAFFYAALLLFAGQILLAQVAVSGIVNDSDGFPDEGAVVTVKGTDTSTVTDEDGAFTINARVGQDDLVIESSDGEASWETPVGSSALGILKNEVVIDEIIVIGYQNLKKDNLTGAVSVVTSEEVEQKPFGSLDLALQGRVAGLNVNIGSGQPGQAGTIILRGRNSFNGENEPLYIIDGVFSDIDNFRSINQNDIETIIVLKDASASALYGSRGAAGVIQVTTKSGRFNSKTTTTYRSLYGFSFQPDANFDVLTSRELLEFQRSIGTGAGAGATDAEIDALSRVNTDWRDFFFRQGLTFSQELTFRGGGENLSNFTSLNYFEQEGVTVGSDLKRFSFRQNNDFKTGKLRASTRVSMNYSESSFVVDAARGGNTGGQLDNPFLTPYIGLPFVSPLNPDGSLNLIGTQETGALNPDGTINPNGASGFQNTPFIALSTNHQDSDIEDEIRIIGSLDAKYDVTKNLTAGVFFGLDYSQIHNVNIVVPTSIRGLGAPTATTQLHGSRTEDELRDSRFTVNTSLSYNRSFGDHDFTIGAYTEYFKRYRSQFGFRGFGLIPGLVNSIGGITPGDTTEGVSPNDTQPYIADLFGFENERGLFSYFSILNYSYGNKYNFQGSIRRDGSSFFPDENEFGTFWQVSGSWNISKENFMSGLDWIDNLSLRASYGTVGNQELFIPFGQFDLLSPLVNVNGNQNTGYNNTASLLLRDLGNPRLIWEETQGLNIGLDFRILKNRISGTVEVYDNDTKDALLFRDVPLVSGDANGSIPSNSGEISNRGVEVQLNADLIRAKKKGDLEISVFGNWAYNNNEIVSLGTNPDGSPVLRNAGFDVGDYVSGFRDVVWAGVNPANGRPLYRDLNGNLTENFNSSNEVVLNQSQDPIYQGGFGANINYKGFALEFLWSYTGRSYRNNGSLRIIMDPGFAGFANRSTEVLNAWKNPGDVTNVASQTLTGLNYGNYFIESTEYLRLRNVSLAYTLNGEDLFKGASLFETVRIYAQGQNLLTFTGFRGFDPESNRGSGFFDFPQPRFVNFGIDVTF